MNVPLGVNGSDANHYIYISGGTGAAEAALITGGTAVSGGTSGTLQFTPANNHSGAWTIQSATAGCQEAYYSNGGTGNLRIRFPAGAFNFYAPCRVNASGVWITGAGNSGTTITQNTANVDGFQFIAASNGQGNTLADLQINGQASSTSGYALDTVNQTYFNSFRVLAINWASGVLNNNGVTYALHGFHVRNLNTGDGYLGTGSSGNAILLDDFEVATGSGTCEADIKLVQSNNTVIHNPQIGGCTNAILLAPGTGQVVASTDTVNDYLDHAFGAGLLINPASGGSVVRTRFTQGWFASSNGAAGINLTGAGVIDGLLLSNCEISGNGSNGLNAANTLTTVQNVQLVGCTVANNAGAGIVVPSNASAWKIVGSTLGNNVSGWGAGSQTYGIFSNSNNGFEAVGNVFAGNAIAPINSFNGGNLVIANNFGIDNVIGGPISSATSIAAPINPIFTVTGTTTITTITNYWTGRRIRLEKTDAGSVTIGGGGNIPGSHTLAQNGSLDLTFDGSNWY